MERLKRFDILAILGSLIAPFTYACSYQEQELQSYYNYYTHNTYYYYTQNYNLCDGASCSNNLYCQSNNCSGGYCASKLQPWAIFLITFFSVFIFITILRCIIICFRKTPNAVVVRNEVNHHQHHNNVHSSAETKRLIVATTHTEVVTGLRESNPNEQNFNNNNNYYGYATGAPYGTQGTGYPVYQGYGYGNPAMGYQTQFNGVQPPTHLNPNQPQTFM